MVKYLKMDAEDAINRFNISRGHDIERVNYINAVRNMDRTNRSEHRNVRDRSPVLVGNDVRYPEPEFNDWRSQNYRRDYNQRSSHRNESQYNISSGYRDRSQDQFNSRQNYNNWRHATYTEQPQHRRSMNNVNDRDSRLRSPPPSDRHNSQYSWRLNRM